MKFLKQIGYIGYVMAKLSKYVKKHNGNFFRFLVKEDSTKLKKNMELVSMPHF